jgi:hypothetical protein
MSAVGLESGFKGLWHQASLILASRDLGARINGIKDFEMPEFTG